MQLAGLLFFVTLIASVITVTAGAQTPDKPNDAEVAHIAYPADNIDIKVG